MRASVLSVTLIGARGSVLAPDVFVSLDLSKMRLGEPRMKVVRTVRHWIASAACCGLLAAMASASAGSPLSWQFTDVTASAGAGTQFRFEFGYSQTRDMMPGGAAAGDIDNDGDIDLIVPQGDYLPLKLLLNRGDGTFESAADTHGLSIIGNVAAGAMLADLDGNGYVDLVLTGLRGFGIRLYLNNGGQFTEATAAWGLGTATFDAFSAAAGDVDGDGRLDLAVSHWDNANYAPGHAGHLWKNQGGSLLDISTSAGLGILQGPGLDLTFTPILADMDGDHQPDLLWASDFKTTRAFHNLGGGVFEAWDASQFDDENGMGGDVGDFDNDGDLDWFVSSIYDPAGVPVGGQGFTGNRLYRNDGGGNFTDVSEAAGVRQGFWGWGSCMVDFDLDGWLDIYHVNGNPFGIGSVFNNDPSRMFVNQGNGIFAEDSVSLGVADTGQGRGIACFDYDRDGDLDIYVTNNEGTARLFRNDSPAGRHGLGVALRQTGPNTQAIGAELKLWLGGSVRLQVMLAGRGFLSSSPTEAHFGLGNASHADALDIRWPDGRTTRIAWPQAQALLVIDDPGRIFAEGMDGPAL